jgi:hypothetical protein
VVASASNGNEYQGFSLRRREGGAVKGGRCIGLTTLLTSCADRIEILGVSVSWTTMGLSRIALPFLPFYLIDKKSLSWKNILGNVLG